MLFNFCLVFYLKGWIFSRFGEVNRILSTPFRLWFRIFRILSAEFLKILLLPIRIKIQTFCFWVFFYFFKLSYKTLFFVFTMFDFSVYLLEQHLRYSECLPRKPLLLLLFLRIPLLMYNDILFSFACYIGTFLYSIVQ